MNVLVVGKGGREHALAWALNRSPLVDTLYAAPGNPGIATLGECVPIASEDIAGISGFAHDHGIDLVVVGPDGALAAGVVDAVEDLGIRAFGPTRAAAEIEWSKVFAKQLMREDGIPTAAFEVFSDVGKAQKYIYKNGAPVVIKADGLAAGKGVVVANTLQEGLAALEDCFVKKKFGASGETVLIEEYLSGEELSVFAFVDGVHVSSLVAACDYKRIYDGDSGPNTGGMGAYSPAPSIAPDMHDQIMRLVIRPTVMGLIEEGISYTGFLYAGLMVDKEGSPHVLELSLIHI